MSRDRDSPRYGSISECISDCGSEPVSMDANTVNTSGPYPTFYCGTISLYASSENPITERNKVYLTPDKVETGKVCRMDWEKAGLEKVGEEALESAGVTVCEIENADDYYFYRISYFTDAGQKFTWIVEDCLYLYEDEI